MYQGRKREEAGVWGVMVGVTVVVMVEWSGVRVHLGVHLAFVLGRRVA